MSRGKNKKSGFFDLTDIRIEPEEAAEAENIRSVASETESEPEKSLSARQKAAVILLVVLVPVIMLVTVRGLSGSSFLSTGGYIPSDWLQSEESGMNTKLEFYPADWETDILSSEEYLQLSPYSVNYSDDGGTSFQKISPDEAYSSGGKGLLFVFGYLDAVRKAEIEKLNGMFTDKYFEENDSYSEKFPMQKIFDIEIIRYRYSNPEHYDAEFDDYYFIVSYKIYRNDGLFRDDIDGESSLPQMFEIFVYDNGEIKINNIFDLPGFTGVM